MKKEKVGNWSMPVHKLPLIMVSNVQKNASFIHKFGEKKSPYHGREGFPPPPPTPYHPLGRFAPSLCPG